MSRIALSWRSLRTEVWEHRGQLGLSVRVTIAAVLSFLLSRLLDVPLPLWTVLTAVILTQVSFGSSVKATLDYLLGTLCGAIYAGAIATLVPHNSEIALAGVLALAVAPLALLGAINPAFGAATFTGVLVLLIPGVTHVGPVESAVYRVIEVAIGGVTAVAVSLLVLPARAHTLAFQAAAEMLRLMATFLPDLFAGLMGTGDAAAIGRIQDSIGQAFVRSDSIAAVARHERINFLAAESSLAPLLRTLLRLRHDLVMIGRAAAVPLPEPFRARLGPALGQISKTLAVHLRQCAEALASRRNPPPLHDADAALDAYADAFAAVRGEGLTRALPADTAERIFTLGFALDQLRVNLHDLDRCATKTARWP
jgi:uncharacterized membrane protein YccC